MVQTKNQTYQGEETEQLLQLVTRNIELNSEALSLFLKSQKIDKLELIAEHSVDVICLHHPKDGRYLYASPCTQKIMGYTPEDLEGKVPYDFIFPEHLPLLEKNIANSMNGSTVMPEKLELLFKTKANGYQWFEGYTEPLYNKNDNLVLILSCTRNIQDRKLAEIERQKREVIQQNLLITSALFEKKKTIINKIEQKILELNPNLRKELRGVLTHIQETLNLDEGWEDFLFHFKQMHPDFYKNISKAYPEVSTRDLKHLALIKLGMTSSDIAKVMLVKKESLRVTRNRLKNKLGLDSSLDLYDFVQNF